MIKVCEQEKGILVSILSEETNPYFNPEKAHDGGGYSQPHRIWRGQFGGEPLEVEVFDTSCGDFGRRWSMYVTFMGGSYRSELDEVDRLDPLDRWTCSGRLPDSLDEFVFEATGYPFNPDEPEEQDGSRE